MILKMWTSGLYWAYLEVVTKEVHYLDSIVPSSNPLDSHDHESIDPTPTFYLGGGKWIERKKKNNK